MGDTGEIQLSGEPHSFTNEVFLLPSFTSPTSVQLRCALVFRMLCVPFRLGRCAQIREVLEEREDMDRIHT